MPLQRCEAMQLDQMATGNVGDSGVFVFEYNEPSLQVIDRGVCSPHSSRSSSEDDMSSNFCGDAIVRPSVASFCCSILMTAGLPPRNDDSRVESEWTRSLGPNPNPDSWLSDGTHIITSASELAISKSFDS
jgi:hypothetical protein